MNSRNPHWLVQVLTFTILFTALLVVMFAFDSTATALSGSGLGFQAPAEDVPLAAAPSTVRVANALAPSLRCLVVI
jgi:hypothetical protein